MYKFSFLLVATALFFSCQHKVDGVIVDEEIEPFYALFAEEAAKRGVVFDNSVEMIEAYIQTIPSTGVLGLCKRNEGNDSNRQTVYDKPYWKTATQLEKEYVVFHELGHCFLGLGHDDDADGLGNCISIMASGLGSCRDNYNNVTRDSLITELFSK